MRPPDGTAVRYRVAAVDLGIKTADPAVHGPARLRGHRAARGQHRGGDPGRRPGRRVLLQRPRRPGRGSATRSAAVRGVLGRGVPVFGICLGSQVLGRALGLGTYKLRFGHRGREPAGQGPGHRAGADHQPQPRVRGRDAGRRGRRHPVRHRLRPGPDQPRQPERRRGRGPAAAGRARVQRPVPPGGGARPARRGRPVRRLLRPDGAASERSPGGGRAMPKREDLQVGAGDRVRADRDRAGLRVRLLRHPGLPGAPAGGHPGQPGQLQPGDDHDRPGVRRRHLRRADHRWTCWRR